MLTWPRLAKESDSKWLAHSNRVLPVVAGTLPSNIKSIHLALVSSEAGVLCKDACCSVQPNTEW